jgi:hypothetical protein
MIEPVPRRFIAGMTCLTVKNVPSALVRHEDSKVRRRDGLDVAPHTASGVVDEHLRVAQFVTNALERCSDIGFARRVARVDLCTTEGSAQLFGELGGPRQQCNGIAVRREASCYRSAVTGPDADDDTYTIVHDVNISPRGEIAYVRGG